MYSETYKECRKYKRHYEKLKTAYEEAKKETGFGAKRKVNKACDAMNGYAESYCTELKKFDIADEYLRGVLQSHYKPGKMPPITKWQCELANKTTGRKILLDDFNKLKDETKRVELIKRSVERLLSGGNGEPKAVVARNSRNNNTIPEKKSILATLRDFEKNKEKYQQKVPVQKPVKSHGMEK